MAGGDTNVIDLTGSIDLSQHRYIRKLQLLHKAGEECLGASISVGLESHNDPLIAQRPGGGQQGVELVGMDAREYALKHALEPLRAQYDYIFIDCPPSLELLTLNALCAADQVLIPVQCEYYALEGLSDLMVTLRAVKKRLNPTISIFGVLLTMYDGRTNFSAQVAEEVRRHFPGKVFAAAIPRNVRLSEAPSHGMPVCAYDKFSRGAAAYDAVAQEILAKESD